MREKSLLFFDIDGTLAIGKDVPASTKEALKDIREKGHIVFICTGRPLGYVHYYFSEYADGFICSNGRFGIRGEEVLYDHPLDQATISSYISRLHELDAGFAFFDNEAGYFEGKREDYEDMCHAWIPGFLHYGLDTSSLHAYNFDIVYHNETQFKMIEDAFKGEVLFNPHTPHMSADSTILGVDKGTAMQAIAEALDCPIENTFAFGDGANDVCMITKAGHGIAMGNAIPALKQQAEFVTTAIHDEGIKNALKHYGFLD